jgi:hypothetical protein
VLLLRLLVVVVVEELLLLLVLLVSVVLPGSGKQHEAKTWPLDMVVGVKVPEEVAGGVEVLDKLVLLATPAAEAAAAAAAEVTMAAEEVAAEAEGRW